MVIKTCIICGEEFDARGAAKCCSPECSKINKRNLNKKSWRLKNGKTGFKKCKICGKEFEAKGSTKCCSPECSKINKKNIYKEWRDNNPEYDKEYYKNHKNERLEYHKDWYKNNRDEQLKEEYIRCQNIISDLCEQYDGDLEQILKNIPSRWQVREAQMRVWFDESYYDGIMAKIELTPVCEVTGESNDLVIHHLYSFNTHPELGADPNNMVRINKDIHKEFHSIYGYGNNTREQWNEFVESLNVKRGDLI